MNTIGPIPRLETERLILRPFCLYDANGYYKLCSEKDVLFGTDMPHEISIEATREWIISQPEAWQQRKELYMLAIDKLTNEMVGSVSLFTYDRHNKADLGYWIVKDRWGKGYATEMCGAAVKYAFEVMKLNKLEANHLVRNPASGRVLEKLGFKFEGLHPEAYLKDGNFEDLNFYGILRKDYLANRKNTS